MKSKSDSMRDLNDNIIKCPIMTVIEEEDALNYSPDIKKVRRYLAEEQDENVEVNEFDY